MKITFAVILVIVLGTLSGWFLKTKTQPSSNLPAVLTNPSPTIAEATSAGVISGHLIYPSDFIPPEMGVCAELIDNPLDKTCVAQIKDAKFSTGVGFELTLPPGNYYVYSFLGSQKAYYTEFVLCGLKVDCPSHNKIPVIVSAGSNQPNILPHDWYDPEPVTSVTPTPIQGPTATATIAPTISKIPSINKLVPDIIKAIPTATPTPIPFKVNIPTIKVNFGF